MNVLKKIVYRARVYWAKRKVVAGCCKTTYPILLVHGIAYRDDMVVSSWGGVPDYLEIAGASVYLAQTEAWASYVDNGRIIRDKIAEIVAQTGAQKINIIAHSKGGIDARYAIAEFQLGEQVASLTTICSPHRGTCIADMVVNNLPDRAGALYEVVDFVGRLMGDKQPDACSAVRELTRDAMRRFNEIYPDVAGVYYQSYGVEMLSPANDLLFAATYLILKKEEGANDGMIAIDSYRWGEFQGMVRSNIPGLGISHLQITGSVFDFVAGINIPLVYVQWISRLKALGY